MRWYRCSSTSYIDAEYFWCRETFRNKEDIVPFIAAAHFLSGYDTAAPYHGLGKMTVAKSLKDGKKFFFLGQLDLNIDDVIKEPTLFISNCCGFQKESMTKSWITSWSQKHPKQQKQFFLCNLCLQQMNPLWKTCNIDMAIHDVVWYNGSWSPSRGYQLYTAEEEMN